MLKQCQQVKKMVQFFGLKSRFANDDIWKFRKDEKGHSHRF
jgi:hypothetical protein